MRPAEFQFLFLALFIIPAIFFLLTQQNTLRAIQPQNRTMLPGQVWLQMIPLLGLIWQFFVVTKISDSVRKELAARNTMFSFDKGPAVAYQPRPTYGIGLAYCVLISASVIPAIKGLCALAGIVCWIIYWIKLAGYKRKLQENSFSS